MICRTLIGGLYMPTKQCYRCKQEKDLGNFYRHPGMADGCLNKCIECAKKDAWGYRLADIDRIRAYDRERGKLPHRKKLSSRIRKVYRKRYPKRHASNYLLNNAVRDRRVQKLELCQDCGVKPTKIHGHHEDYYQPLNVIWLCPPCHKKRHKPF